MARERIVENEAFKAPVRRTLRERTMLQERPKDRSLCSCPAEAAEAPEVQAQSWYPAQAKPAAEASFRLRMRAGALRYSVHPVWLVHSRQFHLGALRLFSLRSAKPVWPAVTQHRRVWHVIGRSVSSPCCFPLIPAAAESLRCSI